MRYHRALMASCALVLIGTAAQADCADELARLSGENAGAVSTSPESGEGIAKDGSLAPLEDATAADYLASKTARTDSPENASSETIETEGVAKDGSLAPLEKSESESDATAMSGQDVAAQQDGEPVAAEEAALARDKGGATEEGADGPTRGQLLAQAQDALSAGNETACLAAVEELKKM